MNIAIAIFNIFAFFPDCASDVTLVLPNFENIPQINSFH